MSRLPIFTLICLKFIVISCQKKETYQTIQNNQSEEYTLALEGKKLMETHCYLCHSPTAEEQTGRIAPPMIAIKAHYLEDSKHKQEFVSQITNFVQHPSQDKVKMPGAVKKFGLMPKQAFPEGSLEKIAHYMHDYLIEEPAWFKDHYKASWQQPGKAFVLKKQDKTPQEIGLEYALETKKLLGKNLMETIQNKGVLEALTFCNHQAIPLTDSMSTHFAANIKRVTNKPRNPKNTANKEELKYLNQYQNDMANQRPITPIVLEKSTHMQFYYPIQTNSMCLQCHGQKNQIKPEVWQKIQTLYPQDMATGYTENQVRGIWSIAFKK